MKDWILYCALFAVLFSATVQAETFHTDAQYCLVCHGSNAQGNEAISAPNLAILPDWYLSSQLQAFQSGWRGHQSTDAYSKEMMAVAQSMSPEDIKRAIGFIRGFQVSKTVEKVAGDVSQGKTLYQTCAACHGAAAEGNQTMGSPPLAGQYSWYLLRQLQAYRSGQRGSAEKDAAGALMKQIALSIKRDQDLTDLVAYITTLDIQKTNLQQTDIKK
ncbi:c-type cytochrome [Rheinheimera sp. 1928-s]|uniref:c-type cytochrome n=1 Tax=Rheinheimera sp. 1928-s TaxID=3033803 RepID=UPI0026226F25|nr:c-type cytochrome [Rheinheimera sp. 1928-s]MDF3124545.1 c-type cytochrome [Rheinheimera sp. 1928-s]